MVRSIHQLRGHAQQQRETAIRARAVLQSARAVQDSLAGVLAGILSLAPKLVEGRSSAEAQASLAGIVSLAANRQGLKVLRLDPLPDSTVGVFNRVGLHGELESDIAGVVRVVKALETSATLLSVTSLAVSSANPYPQSGASEVLRLEIDVSGYYLPRAAP